MHRIHASTKPLPLLFFLTASGLTHSHRNVQGWDSFQKVGSIRVSFIGYGSANRLSRIVSNYHAFKIYEYSEKMAGTVSRTVLSVGRVFLIAIDRIYS